ncbi:MAG: histidine phosphatase family protein [Rhodobacteraceae bacterium]|nr:MAG: histidine phosphatase family protein [Paracoccaceae bacterium]
MEPTRRLILSTALAALALGLAGCGGAAPGSGGVRLAPGTTLILVRHGDRTESDLNAKGRARAAALPAALEGMALDAIYSPGLSRNLDTARPLATARNLPITRVGQERPAPVLATLGAGKTAIWIGNKGNLQSIWDDLGLSGAPPLEYGDLFIVRADGAGRLSLERRRWGPE